MVLVGENIYLYNVLFLNKNSPVFFVQVPGVLANETHTMRIGSAKICQGIRWVIDPFLHGWYVITMKKWGRRMNQNISYIC